MGTLVVQRVPWCGGSASVACSVTLIARQLDATRYFNHTRYKKRRGVHVDLRGRDFAFRKVTRPRPSMLETTQRHDYQRDHEQEAEHKGIDPVTHRAAFPGLSR